MLNYEKISKTLNVFIIIFYLLDAITHIETLTSLNVSMKPINNCTISTLQSVAVVKTRLKKVSTFKKYLKISSDPKLETYTDIEHIKVETCCSGYQWHSETDLCQPICKQKCPKYSHCQEPDFCKCDAGYTIIKNEANFTMQCQAICEKSCPDNSQCLEPNKCVCMEGYQEKFQTESCESSESCETSQQLCILADNNVDILDTTVVDSEVTTEEIISSSSITNQLQCSDDLIYYRGKCRPLKITELNDCHRKACTIAHTICLETGDCQCENGYEWNKTESNNISCIPLTDYNFSEQQQIIFSIETINWMLIMSIIMGTIAVIVLVALLWIKVVRRRRGHMNVQGETMHCIYSNTIETETLKTLI